MRIRGLVPSAAARMMVDSVRPRFGRERMWIFLAVVDHWEPMWRSPPLSVQRERVARWVDGYGSSVDGLADSRGRSPQHSFFYPIEEYSPEFVGPLADLCHAGHGDVEVHLHHDNDTSTHLRDVLMESKERLYDRHGLLAKNAAGQITYGFVHGNWALDNSRPDGRWCGVNDELTVLRETGCYADFTMPSSPSPTQTRTVNCIYYALDDPDQPKSHDVGVRAEVGMRPPEEGILMVQGPLAFDWRRRKRLLLPGIDNADLQGRFPPSVGRFKCWVRAGVHVQGRPDWVFIKLHTHGCQESNMAMLLGKEMREFHESLNSLARESGQFEYFYVTAREMAELVHQAERGCESPQLPN